MANIRRIVLDVLKPHSPNILEIAKQLADLVGVDGVDISLIEMDQKVENVKITCEGDSKSRVVFFGKFNAEFIWSCKVEKVFCDKQSNE